MEKVEAVGLQVKVVPVATKKMECSTNIMQNLI